MRWRFSGDLTYRGDTQSTVVFIGDSEMQQYFPRIARVMKEHRAPVRSVITKARGGCAPLTGIDRKGYGCDKFVNEAFAIALRPEVDTVVIGASWKGFTERTDYRKTGDEHGPAIDIPRTAWVWDKLEADWGRLVKANKRVVVILSIPRGILFDPQFMAERVGLTYRVHIRPPKSRQEVANNTLDVDTQIRKIADNVGATWVHPIDWVCTEVCSGVDKQGRPIYKDGSHLRASVVREKLTQLDQFIYLSGTRTYAKPIADYMTDLH